MYQTTGGYTMIKRIFIYLILIVSVCTLAGTNEHVDKNLHADREEDTAIITFLSIDEMIT